MVDPMAKHVLSEIPSKEYIISDERKAELDAMYSPEAKVARLQEQLEAVTRECMEQARLNGLGAERELSLRAKLEAAEARAARLEASLRETTCPQPCNGRPDDFTAGQCFDAGECGCSVRAALDVKEAG